MHFMPKIGLISYMKIIVSWDQLGAFSQKQGFLYEHGRILGNWRNRDAREIYPRRWRKVQIPHIMLEGS